MAALEIPPSPQLLLLLKWWVQPLLGRRQWLVTMCCHGKDQWSSNAMPMVLLDVSVIVFTQFKSEGYHKSLMIWKFHQLPHTSHTHSDKIMPYDIENEASWIASHVTWSVSAATFLIWYIHEYNRAWSCGCSFITPFFSLSPDICLHVSMQINPRNGPSFSFGPHCYILLDGLKTEDPQEY